MKNLTEGKTLKLILQFSIPILIGAVFNLAYGLADTRIVGSILGDKALAAVGSVSVLSDLLIGFITGMSNGFAVLTARLFGKGKLDDIRVSFALSLEYGMIVSLLILGGVLSCLKWILKWLNVMPGQLEMANQYIFIVICGMFFACIYNVLMASLRAIGDAYTPLIFLIVSVILNIGLDLLCVGKLDLGVRGAAIATIISQGIAAVACFIYTWIKYPLIRFKITDFKPVSQYTSKLLSGGFSMGLMSCLVSFGTVTLQTAINKLGTNIVIAHTGARKLTSLFMMPFSVFGTTMATFAGQNYGAGKIDRIKDGLKKCLIICAVWCAIVIAVSNTICPYLIKAVTATNVSEVIEKATLYLKVDTLLYFVTAMISTFRNSLQGMGDHVTPVISSGLELVGKVIIAMTLPPIIGYWGIIIAEPIVWIIMVIPLIFSMTRKLKIFKKG